MARSAQKAKRDKVQREIEALLLALNIKAVIEKRTPALQSLLQAQPSPPDGSPPDGSPKDGN